MQKDYSFDTNRGERIKGVYFIDYLEGKHSYGIEVNKCPLIYKRLYNLISRALFIKDHELSRQVKDLGCKYIGETGDFSWLFIEFSNLEKKDYAIALGFSDLLAAKIGTVLTVT